MTERKFLDKLLAKQTLDINLDLYKIIDTDNVAELIDEDTRRQLADKLLNQYAADENSRKSWLDKSKEYLKLALQLTKVKNYPFRNSANVIYPLLTEAALQFHAQAFTRLAPMKEPVSIEITGYDKEAVSIERQQRVKLYSNWEVKHAITAFEENMDKMLLALPIIGCMFEKTYHDGITGKNRVDLIYPQNFVVNYAATSMEDAPRQTEIKAMYDNEILTNINSGYYLDFTPCNNTNDDLERDKELDFLQGLTHTEDDMDAPNKIAEMHCLLDLDHDGYKEPYIVEMDCASRSMLAIRKRFALDDITTNEAGDVLHIEGEDYYTKVGFMPNPAGKFYNIGLGVLLGSITKTASSAINQMLDAGKLHNSLGGLMTRRLNANRGTFNVKPFHMSEVAGSVQDLKKEVMFWPTKQPSMVLFQLLSLMIESGKGIANTMDIMAGQSPGQNQPLGTSQMVLQNGMAVFSAVYRRIWRSYSDIYGKLYKLNSLYLSDEKYLGVLKVNTGQEADVNEFLVDSIVAHDFNVRDMDLTPSADPQADAEMKRIMQSRDLMQVAPNTDLAVRYMIEAMGARELHDDIEEWMTPPPKPIPPEVELAQREFEHKVNIDYLDLEIRSLEMEAATLKDKSQMAKNLAAAGKITAETEAQVDGQVLDLFAKQQEVAERAARLRAVIAQQQNPNVEDTTEE